MIFIKDLPMISKDLFSNIQPSYLTRIQDIQDILSYSPFLSGTPATAAGIGLTLCARQGDPSGSVDAHF
jgi:hypothetical protein